LVVVLVRVVWEIMVASKNAALKAKKKRLLPRFCAWLWRIYFKKVIDGFVATFLGLCLIFKGVASVVRFIVVHFSKGIVHTCIPIVYVMKNYVIKATVWWLDQFGTGILFTVKSIVSIAVVIFKAALFIMEHFCKGLSHTWRTVKKGLVFWLSNFLYGTGY
jgi:hypothetical protein